MKEHEWELVLSGSGLEPAAMANLQARDRAGRNNMGGMDLWHCRMCGASVWSYDKPWTHDEIERIYVTALECGGGLANETNLADCDAELVRLIMLS